MQQSIRKGFSTLAAVAALAGTSTGVAAEENVPTVQPDSPVPESVSSETTAPVTVAEVEATQGQAEKATEERSVQAQVVEQVAAELELAEAELADTGQEAEQAQATKDAATPEVIANAKEAITDSEAAVESAENAVAEAEKNLADAQEDVDKQTQVTNSKKAQVATQEAVVSQASGAVDNAQSVLDGVGAKSIYEEQENATRDLEKAKNELAVATEELGLAQKEKEVKEQNLVEASETVDVAQSEFAEASDKLAQAQQKEDTTRSALDAAATALSKAQDSVEAINTITLNDKYVAALKTSQTARFGTTEYKQAQSDLKAVNTELVAINTFKSNPSDKERKVDDVNNLSVEVRKELSLFASDLVNQIRFYFGTPQTVVTNDSVALANRVGDLYHAHEWGWEKTRANGHDVDALEQVDQEYDVVAFENLQTYNYPLRSSNMDVLKRITYQAIVSYMLNGNEWLHAASIAGLASERHVSKQTFFGIGVSSVAGATHIHAMKIPDSNIENSFDAEVLTNPASSQALIDELNSATQAHASALSVYSKASQELTEAQKVAVEKSTTLSNAKSSQLIAKSAKETASQNLIDIQGKVESTKKKIAAATTRKQSADEAVANLNADVVSKQLALSKAKQILAHEVEVLNQLMDAFADEQSVLEAKVAVHSKAEEALDEAKNHVVDAKATLADAHSRLKNYENADEILLTALEKLSEAKQKVATLKSLFNEETNELNTLLQIERALVSKYTETLARFNAQLQIVHADIIKDGKKPVEVKNERGLIVGYKAVEKPAVVPNVVRQHSNPVLTKQPSVNFGVKKEQSSVPANYQAKQSKLPETGSVDSVLFNFLGMGSMLGALGTAFTRKNKTK